MSRFPEDELGPDLHPLPAQLPAPSPVPMERRRVGATSERGLAQGIARLKNHAAVVLSESVIDLAALDLVPRALCEQNRVLPVAADAISLTLVVANIEGADGLRLPFFQQI